MTRYLIIDFGAGGVWETPLEWIATERANYYAEVDTGQKSGPEFEAVKQAEIEYALSESGEDSLMDFLVNNYDWADIAPHAKQVAPPLPFDFDKYWRESDYNFVEK